MDTFKIHFRLQDLDKVSLFGAYPNQSIQWFGLTDGLLWIDVCGQTIYEYSDEACSYFHNHKYNDYQISRFMEDFAQTFLFVGVSVPEELYRHAEEFRMQTDAWKESHINDEDEVFNKFFDEEYCELIQWYFDRCFDSGHLIGGPIIGCFRFHDRIKVMWKSGCKLENGIRIWTSAGGCVELDYERFVEAVKEFLDSFFAAMDEHVKNAIAKDWGNVFLDKERLAQEHEQRREQFYQSLSFLQNPKTDTGWNATDWGKVKAIYAKMKKEMNISLPE